MPAGDRPRVPRSKRAILSLDGGGMRGVLAVCVLEVLEDELRKQSGIDDLLVAECFDLIAGTSTGSIIGSYLTTFAVPGLASKSHPAAKDLDGSVAKLLAMYREVSADVFPTKKKASVVFNLLRRARFPGEDAEGAFQRVFDDNMTLEGFAKVDNKGRSVATLLTTAYDMVNNEQALFIGDRVRQIGRYVSLDHFMLPHAAGNTLGHADDDRGALLQQSLASMTGEHAKVFGPNGAMNVFNLGDSSLDMVPTSANELQYHKSGDAVKPLWTAPKDIKVWQTIRCSTAAPTFFPPARIKGFWRRQLPNGSEERKDLIAVDGGLSANNPAMLGLVYLLGQDALLRAEAFRARDTLLEGYAVLSIGCGVPVAFKNEEEMAAQQSMLNWIIGPNSIIQTLMNNSPAMAHMLLETFYNVTALKEKKPKIAHQYLRIQLAFNKNAAAGDAGFVPLDVVKALEVIDEPENFDGLVRVGRALGEMYRPLIARFVANYLIGAAPRAGCGGFM